MGNDITATNQKELQGALLNLVDLHVRKEYLSELELAQVKPIPLSVQKIEPGSNMRLFHLVKLSYSGKDSVPDKIRSIFSSLSQNGHSTVLLLNGKKNSVDVYLGVCDEDVQNLTEEKRIMHSSFYTAFPGASVELLKTGDNKKLIGEFFPQNETYAVAAVSGSQIEAAEKNTPADNLDALFDAMKYKPFTAVLLSQSIRHSQLVEMRRDLEALYSNIAPLQKQDVSMTRGENKSYGLNISTSLTESHSKTKGKTTSHTITESKNKSTQTSADHKDEQESAAKNSLIGTGIAATVSLLGAALAPATGGASLGLEAISSMLPSLFYGRAIGDALNSFHTLANPKEPDVQTTEGSSTGFSDTDSEQESDTDGTSKSDSKGQSITKGYSDSRNLQITYVNKAVVDLLGLIDEQISELTAAEKNGAFRVGAYFIAGDEETAVTAANVYRSIITSHGLVTSPSNVYRWSEPEKTKPICEYLMRGLHPVFSFSEDQPLRYPDVTVGQPVRIQDIPAHFCIPQKTIRGISVVEHAAFPRDIVFRDNSESGAGGTLCGIGNIFHMGCEDRQNSVSVAMNELTKHLFVAGTTGSGKSNFCYQLLDSLIKNGIKLLVIEPAKGEYPRVFGGRKGFSVYGTNAHTSKLLHINPFAFPKGITVDEHIEALTGIFNNAWPMYSAMPAVLKDALETIYREKGFDMEFQTRTGKEEFPSFSDLLEALPRVVKKSEYSNEVKGNYIGALKTRISSLTKGIYSSVFCKHEIADEKLFDSNVIIDLSRVRSDETKALLMGILVTRLSEYRECSGTMNSPLRHITLLEEAHHLLKANRSAGVEGVSMGAASVEMISNAVAEMRTYGEGFIIADQSPASLDKSVMRNTFTKVFFNLPEREDRAVAASSLELNEEQQAELARIPTGVAVVYHRAWAEPVLARITYFDKSRMVGYVHKKRDIFAENSTLLTQALALLLYKRMRDAGKKSSYDEKVTKKLAADDFYWLGDREYVIKEVIENRVKLLKEKNPAGAAAAVYNLFFDFSEQLSRFSASAPIEKWIGSVMQEIRGKTALNDDEIKELIGLLMINVKNDNAGMLTLYGKYKTYLSNAKS